MTGINRVNYTKLSPLIHPRLKMNVLWSLERKWAASEVTSEWKEHYSPPSHITAENNSNLERNVKQMHSNHS